MFLLKNSSLQYDFFDLCNKIYTYTTLSDEEIDKLVYIKLKCQINYSNNFYVSSIKQFEIIGKDILEKKRYFLSELKKLLVNQGIEDHIRIFKPIEQIQPIEPTELDKTTQTEQTEQTTELDKTTESRQDVITSKVSDDIINDFMFGGSLVHHLYDYSITMWSLLLLDSKHVVFTGGLVYEILFGPKTINNYLTFSDIDLFIIGSDDIKKNIIETIISNVNGVFGSDRVLIGYYKSIINIFIKGFNRSIQLICFGNESTTKYDVINHFDLDHLKSLIFYDIITKEYLRVSTKEAINAIESKVATKSNNFNGNLKVSRVLKTQQKGFNVTNLIDYKQLSINDINVCKKSTNQIYFYKQTENLKRMGNSDFDAYLLKLFGLKRFDVKKIISRESDLELQGDFSSYEPKITSQTTSQTNNSNANTNDETNRLDFMRSQVIDCESFNIYCLVKVLDVFKFDFSGEITHTLILQITNKEAIKTIRNCHELCLSEGSRIVSNKKNKKKCTFTSPILFIDGVEVKINESNSDLISDNSNEGSDEESDEDILGNLIKHNACKYQKKYKKSEGMVLKKTIRMPIDSTNSKYELLENDKFKSIKEGTTYGMILNFKFYSRPLTHYCGLSVKLMM